MRTGKQATRAHLITTIPISKVLGIQPLSNFGEAYFARSRQCSQAEVIFEKSSVTVQRR